MPRTPLLAFALTAVLLAGCGGDNSTGGQSPTDAASASGTTTPSPSGGAGGHVCNFFTLAEASSKLGVALTQKERSPDAADLDTFCHYVHLEDKRIHLEISASRDKRYSTTLWKDAELAPRRHRALSGVGKATEAILKDLDAYNCEAAARYKLPDPAWGDYLWLRIQANSKAVDAGFKAAEQCEAVLRVLAGRIPWTPAA